MVSTQTLIYATRIGAALLAVILFIAALGFSDNFFAEDYAAMVLFFALAILLFMLNLRALAVMLAIAAFIFDPYLHFHLLRQIWVILDILAIFGVAYAVYWATDPYKKGTRFENYVATLFPESGFVIQDRTRDTSKRTKRTVESDMNPDFVFRSIKSGKVFAVECKWRARWWRNINAGEGIWWSHDQAYRYSEYQQKTGIPVYVAFGIGGTPDKPREVYFLELDRLRFNFLFKSLIRSGKSAAAFVQGFD
ncbi:MAG TPA: hypothetical protein VMU25_00635 [Candidatus Paceibacterota bacterium]|nr:hypothetical protein [Candidatus Paceibacterota bacterium]